MTNKQSNANAMLLQLAAEMRPVVRELEAGITGQTTKNHYGAYLPLFSGRAGNAAATTALVLILAGANRDGVAAAFKICTGYELPLGFE